ncbi:hypothetical protein SAMN04487783_1506 [Agrococcus baldri]|uniref:VOC domain-containing protein n=1 Tax=Agrococcus baldri TaxID=153730 RepID=A0AA94KZL6_9MICO|nr:VOC family protein [Agrococcus baldri]SFS11051.1 hypothetical protein SAMN04487783_1506 [Agrococcus baldri]
MSLVVHFEIHASEPQRLIDFYSGLFGWTFAPVPGMDYWTIETGEGSVQLDTPGWGINGGLTKREGPAPAPGSPITGANLVIGTDRVDELFAKGLELGATSQMDLADVPGVGRLGYLHDPDGNLLGLISPDMGEVEQGATEAVDPMRVTPEP